MKNWILQMSTLYRVQDKIICGHLFKIYSVLALINFKVNCLQLSNNYAKTIHFNFSLFEPDTFKIDVTVDVKMSKNDSKTRSQLCAGFWSVFGYI